MTFSAIELHQYGVDLEEASVSFPSARASAQQEQVVTLEADAKESAISLERSGGLTESGGMEALTEGDSDPGSPTVAAGGATLNAPGAYLEELQPDCCDEIGLQLDVPAGQTGSSAVSTAAKASDAAACPPSGTREIDSLACAGATVQQANTVTAVTPLDHAVDLGPATVVRMAAPGSTSTVDRRARRRVGAERAHRRAGVEDARQRLPRRLPDRGHDRAGRHVRHRRRGHELLHASDRLLGHGAGLRRRPELHGARREHRRRFVHLLRQRHQLLRQPRR